MGISVGIIVGVGVGIVTGVRLSIGGLACLVIAPLVPFIMRGLGVRSEE